MITAFVLLNVARDRVNDVARQMADLDGVGEVHSVAGRWDLIAILRVPDNNHLAELVTTHIRSLDGITHSETLTGFRVISKHDLERMFAMASKPIEDDAPPC
ncbi:MAG: Lrp/AsnC ligand binding domain-containing protein [Acidobacteriota bacterium]